MSRTRKYREFRENYKRTDLVEDRKPREVPTQVVYINNRKMRRG